MQRIVGMFADQYKSGSTAGNYTARKIESPPAAQRPRAVKKARAIKTPRPLTWWDAARALDRGDLATAEVGFRKAHADSPGDVHALKGLAWTLLRKGDWTEAETLLRRGLSFGDPQIRELLAFALAQRAYVLGVERDDPKGARAALVEAAALDPANGKIRDALSKVDDHLRTVAERDRQEAVRLDAIRTGKPVNPRSSGDVPADRRDDPPIARLLGEAQAQETGIAAARRLEAEFERRRGLANPADAEGFAAALSLVREAIERAQARRNYTARQVQAALAGRAFEQLKNATRGQSTGQTFDGGSGPTDATPKYHDSPPTPVGRPVGPATLTVEERSRLPREYALAYDVLLRESVAARTRLVEAEAKAAAAERHALELERKATSAASVPSATLEEARQKATASRTDVESKAGDVVILDLSLDVILGKSKSPSD